MKQAPLMSVLSLPATGTSQNTSGARAKAPESDPFVSTFKAVHRAERAEPVRPTANRDQASSGAVAREPSRSQPETQAAPSSSGGTAASGVSRNEHLNSPDTGSDEDLSALVPAEIKAQWEALDPEVQQAFLAQLQQLTQQLEQGELQPEEALADLQQLLADFGLNDEFGQWLAGAAETATETMQQGDDALLALAQRLGRQGEELIALTKRAADARELTAEPIPAVPADTAKAVAASASDAAAQAATGQGKEIVGRAEPATTINRDTTKAPSGENPEARQAAPVELTPGAQRGASAAIESGVMLEDGLGEVKRDGLLRFSGLLKAAVAAGETPPADKSQVLNISNSTPAIAATPLAPLPAERGFTVQAAVAPMVGQPNWGQAVGHKLMWLVKQNISSAELRLDPPDLGPIQVKISVQNDQAHVVFTSHSTAVREALDQSSMRLRELFAEQGLDLVNVDVSDHSGNEAGGGEGDASGTGPFAESGEGAEPDMTPMIEGRLSLIDHYA